MQKETEKAYGFVVIIFIIGGISVPPPPPIGYAYEEEVSL